MKEIWKDIKGYEGLYQVSNLGFVKSFDRFVSNGIKRGKILRNKVNDSGYVVIILVGYDNKKKSHYLHRIVAETFIPNPQNLPVINHKDENKLNNHVSNLEWCTQKENINYGSSIKRRIENQSYRVSQYSLSGDFIASYSSAHEIEDKLGYNYQSIQNCCRHEYNQSYGYIWRYFDDPAIKPKTNHPTARSVAAYADNNKLVKVYDCIADAAKEHKINRNTLSRCCKNETFYKGFYWKFV